MNGNLPRVVLICMAIGTVVWPVPAQAQRASSASAEQAAPSQPGVDHSGHGGRPAPQQPAPSPVPDEHADHRTPLPSSTPPPKPLPPFIPPVTDADRAAAFPDVRGHAVHDNAINYFVLLDQLEWQAGDGDGRVQWDSTGWVGRDVNRLWFRADGASEGGRLDQAEAHALYGRAISRWWDVVAGVRQDVRPGAAQTWAAVGVQGLAPYWFEVEATAYVGAGGRTRVRFEAEYDLLLTNRLVLQPLLELEMAGKADPEHAVGAGFSSADAGLRLRYAFRRELAPYVGVTWHRAFAGTADLARAAGKGVGDVRLALGIRLWM